MERPRRRRVYKAAIGVFARLLAVRSASAVQYDAIQSIRGVPRSAPENQPYISDEITIACVMVLFLGLFTFGKQ